MTDQNKSVETLQTEVNNISAALTEAKKLEDETLQKSKAETALLKTETLLTQVKTAKEEANSKLDALAGKTDATSKAEILKLEKEIKNYETMLTALDSSKTELTTLKAGVVVPVADDTTEKKDEKKDATTDKTSEDKNRLHKQRDGLSDSTEENHVLKNAARIVWWAAGLYLVYRWIKKLFGRGKKKEEKKTGDTTDTEEPGFWKSTFGKVLKWTGIGTGAYYLTHGLITGRRWISDFFNRDKKEKINPDDLKDRYEKEIPEAMRTKYNKFGTTVDEYWTWLWNTDSLWTLKDDENKETVIPKWAIPAAMDNAYDNVWDILDTSGDIKETRGRVWGKIRGLVGELWWAFVGHIFKPMVWAIKGLTAKMFWTDGEPNEEFQKWAEAEDLTRDEQVANLMQKYSMVRGYLNDKRKQLKRKYIEEQLKTEWIAAPTEEQIEDYDQDDELIEARLERDFLKKKIAATDDADSVVVALEWQNIYDTTASKETTAVLDEVKAIRKEIIPNEAIWTKAEASPDVNKDETLRTELNTVSKNFWAHLKEWILQRNIIEGVANGFWILNLDELRNGEADDMEEAMEKLWFSDEVKRFALDNQDFYTKLQAKTLTKADITKFKTAINDYFSLLQQVMVETQSQQENEWSLEISTWFMWRMWSLVSTPTWWVIIWSAFVLAKSAKARTAVKRTINTSIKPIKWIVRPATRKINIPRCLGNKYLKLANYWNTQSWYDNFIKDFQKWKMSYDEALYVYEKRIKMKDSAWPKWKSEMFEGLLESKFQLTTKQIKTLQIHMNNKNIQKILMKDSNATLAKLADKTKAYDEAIDLIIPAEKADFCRKLFVKSEFTSLTNLDTFTKNMKDINIDGLTDLSTKQLNKIAKALGKDIATLKTADEINAKITELKKTANSATDILKNLTEEQGKIAKLVATDAEELEKSISKLGIDKTTLTGKFYQKQVDNLQKFEKKIASFTDDEITAFNALRKMEFKSYHIVEMFEFKKISKVGLEIEKLKTWKAADLSWLLKELKSSQAAGADISDSLIKTIGDIDAKNLVKSADEAAKFAKNIFKFIAKIT